MSQITPLLSQHQGEILALARKTYGSTNQILVSNEELCELAAICAKFPRYSDPEKARTELHSKAIDEVADVLIVLDHIMSIFDLNPVEIKARINGKVDRLDRWLRASDSQEQTMVDREVQENQESKGPCGKCTGYGDFNNLKPGHRCCICVASNYSMFELRLGAEDGKI